MKKNRQNNIYLWLSLSLFVVLISAFFGYLVSNFLPKFYPSIQGDKYIQTIALILSVCFGLCLELILWTRSTIQNFTSAFETKTQSIIKNSIEEVLSDQVMKTIFSNEEEYAKKEHLDRIREYININSKFSPAIQRGVSTIFVKELSDLRSRAAMLTNATGLHIEMNEAASISTAMSKGITSYTIIERAACKPDVSWSPQFIEFVKRLGQDKKIKTKFILLCSMSEIGLYIDDGSLKEEVTYLKKHGFEVMWCDEQRFRMEHSVEKFNYNIEIFDGDVALMMESSKSYEGKLCTQICDLKSDPYLKKIISIIEDISEKVEMRTLKKRLVE